MGLLAHSSINYSVTFVISKKCTATIGIDLNQNASKLNLQRSPTSPKVLYILKCRNWGVPWQITFVNCEHLTFCILQYFGDDLISCFLHSELCVALQQLWSPWVYQQIFTTWRLSAFLLLLQMLPLEKLSDDLWWWWLIKLMWLWVTGFLTKPELQCRKVYNKPLVFHLNSIGTKPWLTGEREKEIIEIDCF